MSIITSIEVQKKNPKRANIYLDGEFAFALSRKQASGLQLGVNLSEAQIFELQNKEAQDQAWVQAMLLLSFRPRSESELRKNLQKHEYSEPVIEKTMGRLRQANLAGDGEFARAWVENRSTFRPRSRRALASELVQKGLDPETIESSLGGVDDGKLAYQAARKKAVRFQELDWLQFRKKLGDFLVRRGFSFSLAGEVVKRVWDESHSPDINLNNEEII
jgi:regulatory protein